MEFVSRYVSHQPDANGYVDYSDAEHRVWQILYQRQSAILPGRAADEFLAGLDCLDLPTNRIPQLPDINHKLHALTGWQVAPVAALISARKFFELLASRYFPAATFIRSQAELDYVQEPDIFHEIFGHCPMLTNPIYADFLCQYAQKVLNTDEKEWPLLQRLFWFTVEFGLIKTAAGVRAYGGGILSSISETAYSVESDIPMRIVFDPLTAFRTPYRIDQLQLTYFVIDKYQDLYQVIHHDLQTLLQRAHTLGEYPPFFAVEDNNPSIHIHAC